MGQPTNALISGSSSIGGRRFVFMSAVIHDGCSERTSTGEVCWQHII